MSAFTRLGASIWDWEPWISLDPLPRVLWLALYTSAEAKRHVPGLWHGGIPSMADAARLPPDDVLSALDALLSRDLVEYDPKCRVLRLTLLPDAGEYPNNGNVILSWWTRFKTVPTCDVRDSHVRTIAWICDKGSKGAGKPMSHHHQQAWADTFGTITIPHPRRRGVTRIADSDTSTQVQPSLFGTGNGSTEQGSPQCPQIPVDNSQLNKNKVIVTVSDTVSDTNRIPDPGSRIPDLLISGEGEGGRGARPMLTLVPPYTAGDIVAELAQGNWDPTGTKAHQDALGALIPVWAAVGVGMEGFAVLRQHSESGGPKLSLRWLLSKGCDLPDEIERAKKRLDWQEVQAKALIKSMP